MPQTQQNSDRIISTELRHKQQCISRLWHDTQQHSDDTICQQSHAQTSAMLPGSNII